MRRSRIDLLLPRILVVDDERQIHASIRLRLAKAYELVFCLNGRDALRTLADQRFDLCFADIHMPQMNGLAFIESAAGVDPELGVVILSAFDSDENLRRAIPLQVYDFIGKPLPERQGFEARIPEWIDRTRQRRRERALARDAGAISRDLDSARLEREVELVASESARDALLQTSSLLTTIHAHLVSATGMLAARVRADPALSHLLRSLEEARKTADAAVNVSETFFNSSYGQRDSSPALINPGLHHAVSIASRMVHAEDANKAVDCSSPYESLPVRELSGIDFLLMVAPAVEAALSVAPSNSTTRVASEPLPRLEVALTDNRFRSCLWLNRRPAMLTQPGVCIVISSAGGAWSSDQAESWLRGDGSPLATVTPRGIVAGIQKAKGLLGIAVAPPASHFQIILALPT